MISIHVLVDFLAGSVKRDKMSIVRTFKTVDNEIIHIIGKYSIKQLRKDKMDGIRTAIKASAIKRLQSEVCKIHSS